MEIAEVLLSRGADVNLRESRTQDTPLHVAVLAPSSMGFGNSLRIAITFINTKRVDYSMRNAVQDTALHKATQLGNAGGLSIWVALRGLHGTAQGTALCFAGCFRQTGKVRAQLSVINYKLEYYITYSTTSLSAVLRILWTKLSVRRVCGSAFRKYFSSGIPLNPSLCIH